MNAKTLRRCSLTSPADATPEAAAHPAVTKPRHTRALFLRDLYLLSGSPPRLLWLFYWPTINMIVWGFMNSYVSKQASGIAIVAGAVLAGAILWDVLTRSQFGLLQPFMEEIWSRNLGNLFATPLRPTAYVIDLMLLSLARMTIAMLPCVFLAKVFFGYWLPSLGLPLFGFALNLIMAGWWFGLLIVAMLLRYGPSAEWFGWMAIALISPFVAVYYPVSVLPDWLHAVSWALPPTYVFEAMRALVNEKELRVDYMLIPFVLNLAYLAMALTVYLRTFEAARRKSGLLQIVSE